MRSAVLLIAAGGLLLPACSDGSLSEQAFETSDAAVEVEMVEPVPPAAEPPAQTPPGAPARAATPAAPATPITLPQIAYSYRFTLETAADRTAGLMRRHEQACVAAGPDQCAVVAASSERTGRDRIDGRLELRVAPAWLARFRAGLASETEAAGGRVAGQSTDSEDLSRSLIDTEARLRALTTLRDRLEGLLATRAAPLDQLLATERELARVQGELDAARSTLAEMRGRVAMSSVVIEYASAGRLAPDSAFAPVRDATDNALAVFLTVVAGLIVVMAGLAPVVLILAPLAWWLLRRRRRKAARPLDRPAPPPA